MLKQDSKRKIIVNAIMAIVQVVAVGIILFVLYKFLLKTIGIEDLGIWSVVLATTSVAGIGNFGLSGSVVKFVAKYVARGKGEAVAALEPAVVSLAALLVLANSNSIKSLSIHGLFLFQGRKGNRADCGDYQRFF